ncbi:hypothetical protein ANN_12116 [Periplaneta americana]|uniref:MADF domain-containing protein n=1 Tax=Periplaneta americana TaxID=6978 RepID=A0ABQ8T8R8_PERAM|nr:hypothetical protein ANN_12116 [Periplaneta americana]
MSPGSSTESYPTFARIGLRENPGKILNQVTFPNRDSNPGHLVSWPDALTVTPQLFSTFCVNVKMQYTLNQRLFLVKQYWITNSITATQRAYQREFDVEVLQEPGWRTFSTFAIEALQLRCDSGRPTKYKNESRIKVNSKYSYTACTGRKHNGRIDGESASKSPELYKNEIYKCELKTNVNFKSSCTQNKGRVCNQSRLTAIVNSNELVSIVRSRNMFAFFSDERAFNIELYFRTDRAEVEIKFTVRKQEDRDITYALFCSVLCIMEQVLFDEILILSVEENPHVYDKRRASYKDEEMKENTWLSIAASLNTDQNRKHRLHPSPRLEFDDTGVKHKSLY